MFTLKLTSDIRDFNAKICLGGQVCCYIENLPSRLIKYLVTVNFFVQFNDIHCQYVDLRRAVDKCYTEPFCSTLSCGGTALS